MGIHMRPLLAPVLVPVLGRELALVHEHVLELVPLPGLEPGLALAPELVLEHMHWEGDDRKRSALVAVEEDAHEGGGSCKLEEA